MGAGGAIPLPYGYLKKVSEKIKKAGGLYISDEVQTGFGRMGSHFFGYEYHDVKPDIVSMAKV